MSLEEWTRVDAYLTEALLPDDPALAAALAANEAAGLPAHDVSPTQGKLLHLLQQEAKRFDVRLVIAEAESLGAAARDGRFDEQLLASLDVHTVRLPPLRRRREDVPGIFLGLLRSLAGREIEVDSDLIEKLCLHDWPFNVRELVTLTRLLLTAHGNEALLSEKHLPDRFSAIATDRSS